MSAIGQALLDRYESTEYRVRDGGRAFRLDLGRPSEPLARLYREWRAASAAFITACNPYSQPATDAQNREANARLRAELDGLDVRVLDAVGSDPAGSWQEPSFLVLGLSRDEARALGEAYRQNAIVFAGANAIPELVLLR